MPEKPYKSGLVQKPAACISKYATKYTKYTKNVYEAVFVFFRVFRGSLLSWPKL